VDSSPAASACGERVDAVREEANAVTTAGEPEAREAQAKANLMRLR